MNSMRNLFIVGVSLFLGLSIPDYFREYTSAALHGPAHTKAGWVSFFIFLPFPFSFCLLPHDSCNMCLKTRAVQRSPQHRLHVVPDCGHDRGRVLGQHARLQGQCQGPRDAMVGQVQNFQRGHSQRGVLHASVQPQQILPSFMIMFKLD